MSTEAPTPAAKPVYNVKNPFIARVKRAYDLSGNGAPKHTRHYDIDLAGSGLEYTPGDSLAVQPTNDPQLVDDTIAAAGLTGTEEVKHPKRPEQTVTLREALIQAASVTDVDTKLVKAIVEKTGGTSPLAAFIAPEQKDELKKHLWGRFVIDLLLENPSAKFEAQEFVSLLKKLNIRLYSISSSQRAHPEEVHLTVATVKYQSHGRERGGVASTFLADRVTEGTPIPVFVNPGKGFRLPDPTEATPVIFCGPGTGIAPFRAFLEERKATAAKGKAWLFFGEVSESQCFFYKEEFEAYLKDGTLAKLTTAWSRDQAEKIYVQHRMKAEGAELWQWLEQGAIFYVCGDASRMAVDVDKALHHVIEEHGGKSEAEAVAYMAALKEAKRYRRDVY
jgi:sulfite reductase (NADPH) flavoprotein alpha-component